MDEPTKPTEDKDPYAEGNHIANPEPDNGAGNVDKAKGEADEVQAQTDQQQKTADLEADQKHVAADTRSAEDKASDKK